MKVFVLPAIVLLGAFLMEWLHSSFSSEDKKRFLMRVFIRFWDHFYILASTVVLVLLAIGELK
jgi:hypothetical protein